MFALVLAVSAFLPAESESVRSEMALAAGPLLALPWWSRRRQGDVLLSIRESDGRVVHEYVSLDPFAMQRQRTQIGEYLGPVLHSHMAFGVREIGIQVLHPQNPRVAESQLFVEGLQRYLETYAKQFQMLANFTDEIVWREGVIPKPWYQDGWVFVRRLWDGLGQRLRRPFVHRGLSFGVDIGGTKLKILVLKDGKTVGTPRSLFYEDLPDQDLGRSLEILIDEGAARFGLTGEAVLSRGLVMSFAGMTHPERGEIVVMTNLNRTRPGTMSQLERFRERHPACRYENDGRVFTKFHAWVRNLRGVTVLFVLGTGLGHGILVNGRLLRSPMEAHVRTVMEHEATDRHGCGPGCAEDYANAQYVVSYAQQLGRGAVAGWRVPESQLNGLDAETVGTWLNLPRRDNRRPVAELVFEEVGATLRKVTAQIAKNLPARRINIVLVGGVAMGSSGDAIKKGIHQSERPDDPPMSITVFTSSEHEQLEPNEERPFTELPAQWHGAAGAALLSPAHFPDEGQKQPTQIPAGTMGTSSRALHVGYRQRVAWWAEPYLASIGGLVGTLGVRQAWSVLLESAWVTGLINGVFTAGSFFIFDRLAQLPQFDCLPNEF